MTYVMKLKAWWLGGGGTLSQTNNFRRVLGEKFLFSPNLLLIKFFNMHVL
jgi:hypothetical protein